MALPTPKQDQQAEWTGWNPISKNLILKVLFFYQQVSGQYLAEYMIAHPKYKQETDLVNYIFKILPECGGQNFLLDKN